MAAIESLEPRQLLSGVNGVPDAIIAVGQDRGSSANPSENMVEVYNARTQQRLYAFDPYADDPRYHGGTRVAVADVTGDGFADIVTAPGGGSLVRAFDGRDGQQLWSFRALEIGDDRALYVAAGDTDGDGTAEVIVSPDSGPGTVRVFDGTTPGLLRWEATPFPQVASGARVAVGDTDGDGAAEVIVAGGEGAPPLVRVLADGGVLVHSFYAYKPSTRGGIYLAAGDADGDGTAEIAASAMANHVVRVFDGQATASNADGSTGLVERYLPAWDGDYSGGLRLAMVDVNADGRDDLIATPHRLPGTPTDLRAYDVQTGTRLLDLDIFADWDNGAFTAGGTNANRPPTVPPGQSITVTATAAAGDVIGQIEATDPEGGGLTYAITAGNDAGLFALAAGTGVLTVTAAPAGPTASSYGLTFRVTDAGGKTVDGSLSIDVDAATNAPPTLPAGGQTITVLPTAAAGDVLGQVEATDPEGGDLTYTITGGNEDGLFALAAGTGVLTATTNLAGPTTSSYGLTFAVSDSSGNTADGSLQVEVPAEGTNTPPRIEWAVLTRDRDPEFPDRLTLRGEVRDDTRISSTWFFRGNELDNYSGYTIEFDTDGDSVPDESTPLRDAYGYRGPEEGEGLSFDLFGGVPISSDETVRLRVAEKRGSDRKESEWLTAEVGEAGTADTPRNHAPVFVIDGDKYAKNVYVHVKGPLTTQTVLDTITADDDNDLSYFLWASDLPLAPPPGTPPELLTPPVKVNDDGTLTVTDPERLKALLEADSDYHQFGFELVAEDGSASDHLAVWLSDAPPLANAGGPYNINGGDSLTLDGSGSSDPDGDGLFYTWDLGDGEEQTGASVTIDWDTLYRAGFRQGESRDVTLTVSDGILERSATASVSVALPTVSLAAADASVRERKDTSEPDTTTLTVTRTGATEESLTVRLDIGGSADKDVDYSGVTETVEIQEGATSAEIVLKVKNDKLVEGDQVANISLRASPNEYKLAAEGKTAIVTIVDNDRWDWTDFEGTELDSTDVSDNVLLPGYTATGGPPAYLLFDGALSATNNSVSAEAYGYFWRNDADGGRTVNDELSMAFTFHPISGTIRISHLDGQAVQRDRELEGSIGYEYLINNSDATLHTVTVNIELMVAVGGSLTKTISGGLGAGGENGSLSGKGELAWSREGGLGKDLSHPGLIVLKTEIVEDDN